MANCSAWFYKKEIDIKSLFSSWNLIYLMQISRFTSHNASILNEFMTRNNHEFLFLNRQMIDDPTNLEILIVFDQESNIHGTAAIYFKKSVEFRGSKAAIETLVQYMPVKEQILYVHSYSTVDQLIRQNFPHLSNIHEELWMTRINRHKTLSIISNKIVKLSEHNRADIRRLFQKSDPENMGTISDHKIIFSNNYIWLGIFDTSELISVIGTTILKGYLINYLATDPVWQNQGLGTCLIDAVFQMIPINENININVRKNNNVAFKLYTKLGFSVVKEYISFSL